MHVSRHTVVCAVGLFVMLGAGCGGNDGSSGGWVASSDDARTSDSSRGDHADATPDTRGRPDTRSAPDSGLTDTTPNRSDTGDQSPDSGVDGGGSSPLSCNEYYKCSSFLCDRHDYQCRGEFDDRLPTAEIEQRKAFNQCSADKCRGKTGRQRTRCLYDECGTEWKKCYTHPDGDAALRCSEYIACFNACWTADNPTDCRATCQKRATAKAQNRRQAYLQCYSQYCQGKRGAAATECVRNNCLREFRACYGC